jgi:hypothetical protein
MSNDHDVKRSINKMKFWVRIGFVTAVTHFGEMIDLDLALIQNDFIFTQSTITFTIYL